jgi:hypothetical protein
MSLKAFHVIFILVCVAFSLGMAAWWGWQWQSGKTAVGLWYGAGWLLAAGVLVVYGRQVLYKMKTISYL